ncbi:uncharacterized protein VTP21DRAFT_491 [Calcarisporiella thermophila]|uniref:uncharacterized protein n=1 Tax=Calcarisporiella thermophila TaxID=911321 RepID=UPI003743BE17
MAVRKMPLSSYLHCIDSHISCGKLTAARAELQAAAATYHNSPEVLLRHHKILLLEGNYRDAVFTLYQLIEHNPSSRLLKEYFCQITRAVQQHTCDEKFALFLKLSPKMQEKVLIESAKYFESIGEFLDACKVYLLFMQAFPYTTLRYGAKAADLIILCDLRSSRELSAINPYRIIFAKEILPQVLQYKFRLVDQYGGKSHQQCVELAENANEKHIYVSSRQLRQWTEFVQGYYLAIRDWSSLIKTSLLILECCGYIPRGSNSDLPSSMCLDYIHKLFNLLHQAKTKFPQLQGSAHGLNCEMSILAATFAYFAHQYFAQVNGGEKEGGILIPAHDFSQMVGKKNFITSPRSSGRGQSLENVDPKREMGEGCYTNSKEMHMCLDAESERRFGSPRAMQVSNLMNFPEELTYSQLSSTLKEETIGTNLVDDERNVSNIELNEMGFKSVDSTMELLHHCRELLSYMDTTLKYHGCTRSPQEELDNMCQLWKLQLDLKCAILLAQAEIFLIEENLQHAVFLYKKICYSLADTWVQYRHTAHSLIANSKQRNQYSWLAIFPLRILYCIAVCYHSVGWHQEASMELWMILYLAPRLQLTQGIFEREKVQRLRAKKGDTKSLNFMRTTFDIFTAKCLRYLIIILANELTMDGYQERTIAQLLVLLQYNQLGCGNVSVRQLLDIIRCKGSLLCRDLLHYIHCQDIIKSLQNLVANDGVLLDIFSQSLENYPVDLFQRHIEEVRKFNEGDKFNLLVKFSRRVLMPERASVK